MLPVVVTGLIPPTAPIGCSRFAQSSKRNTKRFYFAAQNNTSGVFNVALFKQPFPDGGPPGRTRYLHHTGGFGPWPFTLERALASCPQTARAAGNGAGRDVFHRPRLDLRGNRGLRPGH